MSDLYLIVDLEATCWEPESVLDSSLSETIEIGAVVFDGISKSVVHGFQTFVRPVINPILSDFCKELTTISQEDVDNAPAFPEAIEALHARILANMRVLFSSWGDYDRAQFRKECKRHKIRYPFGKKHFNIKELYAQRFRCRPCGMNAALDKLHLPLVGTHHRALDDARNIARILARLL